MPQSMGPEDVPPAAAAPKADAVPVAVAQVSVSPVTLPVAIPQAATQIIVGVPTRDPDPEGDDPDVAKPAAPTDAALRDIRLQTLVHPQPGRDRSPRSPDGIDVMAQEHAEHGPIGGHGTQHSMHSVGPAATSPGHGGGSVAAAVIAAIPPATAGTDRVEVILSPEELGRVQMEFRAEGNAMRVFLTAERPETLDLLRRHADQLASELRQAGYSGASLSFGQWGQPQGEARQTSRLAAIPPAESHISGHEPAYTPKASSGRGLDLRI